MSPRCLKPCPHCSRPVPLGCVTCLRSECQEAEYRATMERVALKRRRSPGVREAFRRGLTDECQQPTDKPCGLRSDCKRHP